MPQKQLKKCWSNRVKATQSEFGMKTQPSNSWRLGLSLAIIVKQSGCQGIFFPLLMILQAEVIVELSKR